MQKDFLCALIDSTAVVLEGVLKTSVRRGKIYYKSTAIPDAVLAAAVGAASGGAEQLFLDFEEDTALRIASAVGAKELASLDEGARASIDAFAGLVALKAASGLGEGGGRGRALPVLTKIGSPRAAAGRGFLIPFETREGRITIGIEFGRGPDQGRAVGKRRSVGGPLSAGERRAV
jgi:CheY-specific phosphatase CheX